MKNAPQRIPWLWGILTATLFVAILAATTVMTYYGNDDIPILRSFLGYDGGVPAHYHPMIHTVFAWLLYGLTLLFPGVAWFSILQLFLLWFSAAVIVKNFSFAALKSHRPAWAGSLLGLLFLFGFTAYITARVSFTTTAALVGAAAVAQLLGLDCETASNRSLFRGILLSVLLLMACYGLRQVSLLPPLLFWGLGLVFLWFSHFTGKARPARPLWLGLLVFGGGNGTTNGCARHGNPGAAAGRLSSLATGANPAF